MSRFLDKLHKTAVTCLMGLTVGTGVILSMQVYEFVTRSRSGRPMVTSAVSDSTEGENLENSVATSDLEKSMKFYKDILGAKISGAVPMPEHGVTTVFVELSNTKMELLLPLGDRSPVEAFLGKNPAGGMHHVCLEVDNIRNAVADLREKNVRLLGSEPKIGAHGKPVIFLHPKDCGGVLIELEEA